MADLFATEIIDDMVIKMAARILGQRLDSLRQEFAYMTMLEGKYEQGVEPLSCDEGFTLMELQAKFSPYQNGYKPTLTN